MRMFLFGFISLIAIPLIAFAVPLIANGDMTKADQNGLVVGWPHVYDPMSVIVVSQDLQTFHSEPASLRIDSPQADGEGNVGASLPASVAGKKIRISIQAKREATLNTTQLALFSLDQNFKPIAYSPIIEVQPGDFARYEAEIDVPAEARDVRILYFIQGKGSAWIDDVAVALVVPPPLPKPTKRSDASPVVKNIAMVSADVLGIEVEQGTLLRGEFGPYEKQPGDEVVERTDEHGQIAERTLIRNGKLVGWISGKSHTHLTTPERIEGDKLDLARAIDPATYDIQGGQQSIKPIDVSIKSKPIYTANWVSEDVVMRHRIYLKLDQSLKPGTTYTINTNDLNLKGDGRLEFEFDPSVNITESIHLGQVGFRPDDPSKMARVSIWTGSKQLATFSDAMPFRVVNTETNRVALNGKTSLRMRAGDAESGRLPDRNYNQVDVHLIDFSSINTPGTYRIVLDGIGASHDFRIAIDVWSEAFRNAMVGFLVHRSGIAIDKGLLGYDRPRGFHPDDGFEVRHVDVTLMDTGNGFGLLDKEMFTPLINARKGEVEPRAFGGYMDAGDFDRRAQHLEATLAQLELFAMFPERASNLKLTLPPAEANDALPDLLNEAEWSMLLYKNTQHENGGIHGGVESLAHPVKCEPSWLDSLPAVIYAPDVYSSSTYAATAARFARVVEQIDPTRAKDYAQSAIRAFDYVEANWPSYQDRPDDQRAHWVDDARNLAAIELYRLTRETKYHDIFKQDTVLDDAKPNLFAWGSAVQRDAAFVYATLPDELADSSMKQAAIQAIISEAEGSIAYAHGNAFGIPSADAGKPHHLGYYSSAGMARELVRAHAITGEAKFLAAAVDGVQFSVGANPSNRTFTTGLGHDAPTSPLHCDARASNQPAPAGIVVYGPFDVQDPIHQNDGWLWAIRHFQNKLCTPALDQWPITESYVDMAGWPLTNEYTIHQTMGPNAYVLGYLALRK